MSGTLKQDIPAQKQELPGLQKEMKPEPFDTHLETSAGPRPYVGSGKLKGKKALITGGDSSIGRAVAILFGREGADVSIVHLPEEQTDADDTVRAIKHEGQQGLSIAFDLEDFKHAHAVVDRHVAAFGQIDVLVNNASKRRMTDDFAQIDLDAVESTFQNNILQMFAVTKFALPHMPKGSSIINTTSVTTFRGSGSMPDYVATQGAIVGFTRSLAKDLVKKGIRVNAVAPGPLHTPLQPASRPPEQMEGFGSKTQIGRVGQPSEIAPSYVFLASAESELYYGQILHPYPLGD
ncbi:general stress protein 39 [Lentinus tigrinus ALCF2SS1-7]|uniref:General stress protein 39 n=1 Tax=Lentinus tigrinus ALCF2SS1-6 TaxID=1328759 RepID=A0A5C2S9H6_9APHY|nr:general stress protein 39 [Lentinus tigrinus ALCF2SS1-6]RPD70891.1 general stress protein 39 [Lentinus tigrinus ALCF2SS1-7]